MYVSPAQRMSIIAVSPFATPDARLVAAASNSGALGVLDLGSLPSQARQALRSLRQWTSEPFGVRVDTAYPIGPEEVFGPDRAHPSYVLLAREAAALPAWSPDALPAGTSVLAEVRSLEEAIAAQQSGVHGLISRGSDGGGLVGPLSSFVLLQQLLGSPDVELPVWASGGIGAHTARAAVAGGAAGILLDSQLALLEEAGTSAELSSVLSGMDGSETTVVDGYRVLRRRGPGREKPAEDLPLPAGLGSADLSKQLVPIGQDGFLAARFKDLWGTIPATVKGLRKAVQLPTDPSILLPDSPLAQAMGTTLGLAQGPMTRVSDQPAFAAAVAQAGGLPFIALALSNAEQSRKMLEGTREQLGEKPWGVGILGFADDATKEAQLDIVHQIRPSHAIIAGGRPAQALSLEAVGIKTFLHVPSPALLDQFLTAGARRFIFEGSECGGHIGPRNSFALWEAQLAVLEDRIATLDGDPVTVYFAGGISDERSAAMIAALAAPLAAQGALIGLLAGTAYLFTAEAVSSGAISRVFQDQVVTGSSTAMLETAPGHATRCVSSPFTEEFLAIKARLKTGGVQDREAWQELESLNLGRLRLASKGIERVGSELQEVDPARQLSEGMFMAGEVVALRSAVTTVAELHATLSSRAAEFLAEHEVGKAEQQDEAATAAPLDIAVVGMAGLFAGSPDLAAFWATIVNAEDRVTEVDPERWDPAVYYDRETSNGIRTPSKWGGFLPEIPFDPLRYGIPPASLASIEPAQLLALEVTRRALEDAQVDSDVDRSKISVFFGAEAGSDLSNASLLQTVLPNYVENIPAELAEQLPRLTEDSFPGMLSNVIAGRIASRLDLGGANYTVDAACASSLAALDVACKELAQGTSNIVLCGGVDLHNTINDYLLFASVTALSPTGRSRAFDRNSDGIALGEGVGCLVLKRLADAERDGDRIYSVIRGIGSSSDGKSLGLTAPRPEGQRSALERAYRNARVEPSRVGLVEAHGTGTVVGDRTELSMLTKVFLEAGVPAANAAIGSVKSQIGHTKCAAGIASMIKVSLAIYNGVKPPTLHIKTPSAAWEQGKSPFVFNREAAPWPVPLNERFAGVSGFGFGGTNFHVVLSGHKVSAPQRHSLDEWPAELFLFRGDSTDAIRLVKELGALVSLGNDHGRPWKLRDLAASNSLNAASSSKPVSIAVVARDIDELSLLLARAAQGEHDPAAGLFSAVAAAETGSLAFLYPGQGSQKPGMLKELFVAFPELHETLALGGEWLETMLPPAAFDAESTAEQLARITDTTVAQPVLGLAALALGKLLAKSDIRPEFAAGHSYGELAALAAAGVIDAQTLIALSTARAEAVVAAIGEEPGKMAAISASAAEIETALERAGLAGSVTLANRNSPTQTVISGASLAIETAVEKLREAGLSVKTFPVACAFHSPVIAQASANFAEALTGVPLQEAEIPVWSNRTATPYPTETEAIRAELAAQVTAPVHFVEQIESMYAAGARTFVEVGPGQVLSKLVTAILGNRPHTVVPLAPSSHGSIRELLIALATLATRGTSLSTEWLYRGRSIQTIDGSVIPVTPAWTVNGVTIKTRDRKILPGALTPARRLQEVTVVQQTQQPGNERDALVTEFLRTSREMVAAQRDVLLGYLGTASSGPAVPSIASQSYPAVPLASAPVGSGTASRPSAESGYPSTSGATRTLLQSPVHTTSLPDASHQGLAVQQETAQQEAAVRLTPAAILSAVVEIISARTGYPAEMIEPDLDLEADLSIDSIKRTEIAGELASKLAGSGSAIALDDSQLEELSKARTTGAIADWLSARLGSAATLPAVSNGPAIAADTSESGTAPILGAAEILAAVVEIISARTGYPAEMIEPDLDLEADLSIDSIKRTEIAGELAARFDGQAGQALDGTQLEELSKARTTGAIADWLLTALNGPGSGTASTAADPLQPTSSAPAPTAGHHDIAGHTPERLIFRKTRLEIPSPAPGALEGANLLVIGSGEITANAVAAANALGASAQAIDASAALAVLSAPQASFHGVLYLDPLDNPETASVPDVFPLFKAAVALAPRYLLAARPSTSNGHRSAERTIGLRGLFRSLAREYPETLVRLVDLEPTKPADAVAAALIAELTDTALEPIVDLFNGERSGLELASSDLGLLGATGAGPAGDGAAEAEALQLDRDAVVILIGGARGITAKFAATLASTSRCRIELFGRTALSSDPESPDTAVAADRAELRQILATRPGATPASVDREASEILARREVNSTMESLRLAGSTVEYQSLDVRDAGAVRAAITSVQQRYGRIDGVVYAAGVIEDKLVIDKDPASFRRVYSTKVDGAATILEVVDSLPVCPSFVVFFGSIAAALGNRGQSDYAAANDALEAMGTAWSLRTGKRAVTVHWGPWAPSGHNPGMVSHELGRDYIRRGIKLIDPEAGTHALLKELAWGERDVNAVVYTASGW
ncbi:SDR family NAD(P)-dependent oxidoreductase [Psychromicrobium sp. YIM B11713]|uniref:SDR family NAD(P)-dependent oxidoreductase n=1 Tax=Psychromicrobium sp. YIM B11713 TaxID=3145233 RepID=UPI00374E289E